MNKGRMTSHVRIQFVALLMLLGMGALGLMGRSRGRFRWLPVSRSWTKHRDFPAPQGATFQARWRKERGARRA